MNRNNLSFEVRDEIRNRIVDGRFSPGERLNEVHLSKEFSISRTPLREALFGLANEGMLSDLPRRGFFVPPLSVEEIRELYAIRLILDPAAMRMGGFPDDATISKLRKLNQKIAAARKPRRIVELDDEWHLLLVAGCNNKILLNMIRDHMVRTRRYELAYMSHSKNVGVATDEHELILDALEDRKLGIACKRLEQNMNSAESPLIEWVASLNTK